MWTQSGNRNGICVVRVGAKQVLQQKVPMQDKEALYLNWIWIMGWSEHSNWHLLLSVAFSLPNSTPTTTTLPFLLLPLIRLFTSTTPTLSVHNREITTERLLQRDYYWEDCIIINRLLGTPEYMSQLEFSLKGFGEDLLNFNRYSAKRVL